MPHYQSRGLIPKKRFTVLRKPDGQMYYEQLLSTEQLMPESSLLYRLYAPSRVARVESRPSTRLDSPGRPVARSLLFRPDRIESSGDFLEARVPALFSDERLIFNVARPTKPMENFYCNIAADELILVIKGSGTVETTFGDIPYREFDLVHIPRGVTYRWVSDPVPHDLGVVESQSPIRPPKGFIKANGQLEEGASYHERDLRTPILREPRDIKGEFEVVTRSGTELASSYLDHHPFDVAGWDGCYYPFAFNLKDYEPISGRIFLLVDRYQLFATDEAAFVAVVPRRLADIPDAATNPFHHNVLCDEVLYRIAGVTSPTDTGVGTFTLTPRGVLHGPKPGFEKLPPRTHFELWGLLMETHLVLKPSTQAMAACDASYSRAALDDQLATNSVRATQTAAG
jgi:homogentisate 1,2-dioxygenase